MKKAIISVIFIFCSYTFLYSSDAEKLLYAVHSYITKGDYLILQEKSELYNIKKEMEEELKGDPEDEEAYGNLSYVYFYMGLTNQALDAGLKSIKYGTDEPKFINMVANLYAIKDNPDKAKKYYSKTLEEDDENKTALFNMALIYINEKQFKQAKKYLNRLYEEDNEYYELNYLRGNIAYEKKEYDKAKIYYKMEVKNYPSHAGANYHLGKIIDAEKGDLDEIIHWYYQASLSDPFNRDIRKSLISAWKRKGKAYKDIIKKEKRMLKIKRMDSTLYNYVQYYERLAEEAFEKKDKDEFFSMLVHCMAGIAKLLKKHPDYPNANNFQAALYLKMQTSFDKVEPYFDKEEKYYPNNSSLFYNKAYFYTVRGINTLDKEDIKRAKSCYEKCLLLDPLDKEAEIKLKKINDLLKKIDK